MTSGKEDEEFFRQRGFGIRMGFGERPALIVIDMINGFTDPAMPLGANLDGQIVATLCPGSAPTRMEIARARKSIGTTRFDLASEKNG